jgi:glycosyltransferase involved in cell wall biosynthesis
MAHAFAVGGAEEMVLNLVRRLPPRFEPVVCCIHAAGPLGEEIRATGVPFRVLGLTPGLKRPFDVFGIRNYLREMAPHILHPFLLTASLYGRAAAMLARVPVVLGTEVNVYADKRRWHALAERLLMKKTDAVIASAESVRAFYVEQVQADPRRVEVIYNAVDWSALDRTVPRDSMRASLGIPPAAPLACIIARLTEQKGHRDLVEALAATPALAALHVLVVGDGALREPLQELVRARSLGDRVHFLGARRDLGDLLGASDLFVMPSLWEGLPLSMILALGAGLGVVATRVAGIPEVVKDGETGLLVPPGDPRALGDALARLVADEELRARLGASARAFVVPRFGVDGYVASVSALYDRLLAEKGVR